MCVAETLQHELQDFDQLQLKEIMMDYEKGMNIAFRSTFEGASMMGCDFHWKSILR